MKYAIAVAAIAGLASAIPAGEWEPVKCEGVEKTYTTKSCGLKENDGKPGYGWNEWENCHDVTYTTTEYPTECPATTTPCTTTEEAKVTWAPAPVKDDKCYSYSTYTTKECGDHPDAWDNCHDATYTKTDEAPCTTWAPAPVKEKCYETKTYTTKECGKKENDGKPGYGWNEWENCHDVTYTTTYEASTCTEWYPVTATATWSEYKCPAVTKAYTSKECGKKENDGKPGYGWSEWENCKDVTYYKTEYPTECPSTTATWAPVTAAPVAPASTWAPYKVSSTVAAPVAKWTGAADKQSFGIGAIAIAAVAALL